MQFIVKAYDGAGMLDKRMEVRPLHLEGMARLGKHVVCAGGLLDEEGKMKGSALIMDFPDRKGLDDYLASEPYVFGSKYPVLHSGSITTTITAMICHIVRQTKRRSKRYK